MLQRGHLSRAGYAYDARGNVTTTTAVAKPGSGLANIVSSASFDATCSNPVKCNKPNSTMDARGKLTDYTYDTTHGGVLTVTQPAPSANAARPQTRFGYTQVASASGNPVFMLTSVKACPAGATCVATDEVAATTLYNSSLLPTSVTRGNSSGTVAASSAMTYDARGNTLTVDGPLAGAADTTVYKYDSADQLTGVISPDPDAGGPLSNRAVRLTYRPDGQVSKQEFGTTAGQSDASLSSMTVNRTVDVTFDGNNRPTHQKLSSGTTAFALTQASYDAVGRVDCQAVRMNIAVYGSLPASACSASTQGSDGPDRISQLVYDAAGEVTQLKLGVGTANALTERVMTYTSNGMLATLKDAENNLTTYEYDGFDRLAKIRYPSPTKGAATSSTTDFEQFGYDPSSNVTSRRLRNGTSIAFGYDDLDRVVSKNLPGTELDTSYVYDNLGRLTSANHTGSSLSVEWDALSRKTSETGPNGVLSFGYDAASRRTSVTYPGTTALTINYAYLVTGELDTIKQGLSVLADYSYDSLGNRTGVLFEGGASQSFGYDAVGRLSSLSNNLTGTANDLSMTLSYNAASQIRQAVRTGDAYAFGGLVSVNRGYGSNGLNQYTSAGSATFGYDTKGNLTSDGSNSFTYTSENLMKSGPGSASLTYDPAMRLSSIGAGTAATRFAYDGIDLLAEHDGAGTLQRRYVYDPTTGQPVAWYEGTGTAAANRRYLGQDERGSVISVADSAGAPIRINAYDEYGIPGSSNLGRFQYTGQAWLSEIGLQYSRARIYSPTLGRFMQTDPIGQADDPNLYAYVGNDPVNLGDPLGLFCTGSRIDSGCPTGLAPGSSGSSTIVSPEHWNRGEASTGGTARWWENPNGSSSTGTWICINCGSPAVWEGNSLIVPAPQYVWVPYYNFGQNFRNETPSGASSSAGSEKGDKLCPRGALTFGGSYGGTVFLGTRGASGALSLSVTVPGSVWRTGLSGISVSLSGSFTGMVGLGLFAGFGPGGVLGSANSPPSGSQVVQGGVAWGGGAEIGGIPESGQVSVSTSYRGGYGAYIGGGPQYTTTRTIRQAGC